MCVGLRQEQVDQTVYLCQHSDAPHCMVLCASETYFHAGFLHADFKSSNFSHAGSVYSVLLSHTGQSFTSLFVSRNLPAKVYFNTRYTEGNTNLSLCSNIGLFVPLGKERGKENNRCEDQNILNSPGGNTVSISSQKAVLTLPWMKSKFCYRL